ncbi:phage repressor protein CI [Rouxiella chamberiensis]|uniref:Phage repressor protein CI n=1 Tax=Rouxiella chamberiensis TaxID=1513468 RepID=A0ABY7HPS6_9GAMM|nr:phage repressor protein CI [Rouxiella chamberiensis]WAT01017.1 phage repressor protein CI [Rouxiella chamberiensis]
MSLQINFETGGGKVLDRVLAAYGFTTKIALCEHLGIASSSLANRYKRDFFPSDIVIRCIAETGASLKWLATGEGTAGDAGDQNAVKCLSDTLVNVPCSNLINGELRKEYDLKIDSRFLPNNADGMSLHLVIENSIQYFINKDITDLKDGKWLVQIEGALSIRTLTRIPVGRGSHSRRWG